MQTLRNPTRDYAWGSTTAIQDLLGSAPDGRPCAELWLGAHPDSPSVVGSEVDGRARGLDELLAADPQSTLGPAVRQRFGAGLPFLLKVIAAARPLSLQVHPSARQAAEGFTAEQAAGLPAGDGRRRYRDDRHKPELVLALTPFEALCGFRDPVETATLLELVGVPQLRAWGRRLRDAPAADAVRTVLEDVLTGAGRRPGLVEDVAAACADLVGADRWGPSCAAVVDLAAEYPGDPGVLVSLLLHRVSLAPGEAMFVAPGQMHCYLRGSAVEVMASSDNVLRGGLTRKHVDVPELLRVTAFDPRPVPWVTPEHQDGLRVWRTPAEEFQLTQVEVAGRQERLPDQGPRILLCLDGAVTVGTDGAPTAAAVALERGRSVFVPAAEGAVILAGRGTVLVAAVRQDLLTRPGRPTS